MAPKPYTRDYYEMLARNERSAAKERRQTVESTRVHLANAEQYDRLAASAPIDLGELGEMGNAQGLGYLNHQR